MTAKVRAVAKRLATSPFKVSGTAGADERKTPRTLRTLQGHRPVSRRRMPRVPRQGLPGVRSGRAAAGAASREAKAMAGPTAEAAVGASLHRKVKFRLHTRVAASSLFLLLDALISTSIK